MRVSLNKLLTSCNITRRISDHICNEHRTRLHRRIAGSVLIFIGVIVSKFGGDIVILHVVFDAFGYAIHGIGLIPFLTELEKK